MFMKYHITRRSLGMKNRVNRMLGFLTPPQNKNLETPRCDDPPQNLLPEPTRAETLKPKPLQGHT